MKFDPLQHHRHSTRLKDYDYAQEGAYFVTLCSYRNQCLFGNISDDGEMLLNTVGCVAFEEWEHTEAVRENVVLDEFVIMPNHIHGIVIITGDSARGLPAANPYKITIRETYSQRIGNDYGPIQGDRYQTC